MEQIKPKGTRDFIPEDTRKLQFIEKVLKREAEVHNFREIRTPMFEHTEVFARSSGEGSDIVNKEMYTFLDRGNRSISLRPEGTAGVIRSFVENKMYANADLPVKLYYIGPNFRYERPQAGRYRQFSQFGIENIGVKSPYVDAECILLAVDILTALGINNFKIKINSIGDKDCRAKYCEALKEHFKPYLNELCEDCKVRIEKNPLRILDCKVDKDHPCMKNYPSIEKYISEESKMYFNQVVELLKNYSIPYEIDNKLVRGLDYYNDVVFEISASTPSGIDYGALIGGGRYDYLVEQFNGPSLPSFGFGLGVDRIAEVCKEIGVFDTYKDELSCYVMPMNEDCLDFAFYIATYLRYNGVDTDVDYQLRSLKSQFKTVDRKNALFSLIIGEDEVKTQSISVRFNKTKEQQIVQLDNLIPYISDLIYREEQKEAEKHCGCGCGHHDCECVEDGCDCGEDGCSCDADGCCCGEEHDHECCGHHEHDENHECKCHNKKK